MEKWNTKICDQMSLLLSNRPFPSSPQSLFQSGSKCETFVMIINLNEWKLIFITGTSPLASLWNGGWCELGNSLTTGRGLQSRRSRYWCCEAAQFNTITNKLKGHCHGSFSVLHLGHNWLNNESWYLIQKQQHSLYLCLHFWGFLAYISSRLENVGPVFSRFNPFLSWAVHDKLNSAKFL